MSLYVRRDETNQGEKYSFKLGVERVEGGVEWGAGGGGVAGVYGREGATFGCQKVIPQTLNPKSLDLKESDPKPWS
jgi:hypothetical protein